MSYQSKLLTGCNLTRKNFAVSSVTSSAYCEQFLCSNFYQAKSTVTPLLPCLRARGKCKRTAQNSSFTFLHMKIFFFGEYTINFDLCGLPWPALGACISFSSGIIIMVLCGLSFKTLHFIRMEFAMCQWGGHKSIKVTLQRPPHIMKKAKSAIEKFVSLMLLYFF